MTLALVLVLVGALLLYAGVTGDPLGGLLVGQKKTLEARPA